ncbi:MAG: hypothetical protein AAGI66_06690 [Cyanobacteria bacterium P01_H01_bin.74]
MNFNALVTRFQSLPGQFTYDTSGNYSYHNESITPERITLEYWKDANIGTDGILGTIDDRLSYSFHDEMANSILYRELTYNAGKRISTETQILNNAGADGVFNTSDDTTTNFTYTATTRAGSDAIYDTDDDYTDIVQIQEDVDSTQTVTTRWEGKLIGDIIIDQDSNATTESHTSASNATVPGSGYFFFGY